MTERAPLIRWPHAAPAAHESLTMSTKRVTLAEANGHLAELIEAAERGDEIIIESENQTQVKLVAVPLRRWRRSWTSKCRMIAIGCSTSAFSTCWHWTACRAHTTIHSIDY